MQAFLKFRWWFQIYIFNFHLVKRSNLTSISAPNPTSDQLTVFVYRDGILPSYIGIIISQ